MVIGHPGPFWVSPGERVRRADLVARAPDGAAPDGWHLHFEVRPAGGSCTQAIRPCPYIDCVAPLTGCR